jgi:hypothetical protein
MQPFGEPHEREGRGGAWERGRDMFSTHEISYEFLYFFLSTWGTFI